MRHWARAGPPPPPPQPGLCFPGFYGRPLSLVTVILSLQMDHDPRNPAYIATQGPLPATVADFWQVSLVPLKLFLKVRSYTSVTSDTLGSVKQI